jgi:hypothetical protein
LRHRADHFPASSCEKLSLTQLKLQPINKGTGEETDDRPTHLPELADVDRFNELLFIL